MPPPQEGGCVCVCGGGGPAGGTTLAVWATVCAALIDTTNNLCTSGAGGLDLEQADDRRYQTPCHALHPARPNHCGDYLQLAAMHGTCMPNIFLQLVTFSARP